MSQDRSARTHIANLAALLNSFQPILVNERGKEVDKGNPNAKWNGKFKPKPEVAKPPTFDETLDAIGKAIMEIREFVKMHEELREQHAKLTAQLMMTGTQLGSLPFLAGKPLDEGAEILVARFRQSFDFISHVEKTCPNRETAEAATKFLEPIRKDSPSKIIDPSEAAPGLQLLSDPPPGEGEDIDRSLDG